MRKAMLASVLLGFLGVHGAARAGDAYAYLAAGNGTFGVLDLTSGAFKLCGTTAQTLAGLAQVGAHKIYGGYFGGNAFGLIDPATGQFTQTGTSNIVFESIGSSRGRIYALDQSMNLYALDPATAVAVLIGSTGLPPGGWFGMSTGADKVYFNQNQRLYLLNLTAGHAKRVARSASFLGAMTQVGDELYAGVQATPLGVDAINLKNYHVKTVSTVSNEANFFWGLAPAPGPKCGL